MTRFKYSTKFLLQQDKEAAKLTPVRCYIRFNNKRCIVNSGISIQPKFWNAKLQVPKQTVSLDNYDDISSALNNVKKWVDQAFNEITARNGDFPDPDELSEVVTSLIKNKGVTKTGGRKKALSFFEYYDKFVEDSKSGKRLKPNGARIAAGTIKKYNSARGVLDRFVETLPNSTLQFNDITLDFYLDLKQFCFETEKLSNNYFATVVQVLKLIMNESLEEKIHSNTQHNSRRFVKTQVEVENVYLTAEQLEKLAELDLSDEEDETLAKVRDLFLVGCWTGLRFSDFNNITPAAIQDDFIELKTQKTGERVAIPIHPTVRDVMSRYEGKTHNSLPPSISNQKMNAWIKVAAKRAKLTEPVSLSKMQAGKNIIVTSKLCDLVTTHTARRSFASNMFKMGVPGFVIMAVTGHRTEKAFLKYIKVSPKEKAEMMREVWARQAMKAV